MNAADKAIQSGWNDVFKTVIEQLQRIDDEGKVRILAASAILFGVQAAVTRKLMAL